MHKNAPSLLSWSLILVFGASLAVAAAPIAYADDTVTVDPSTQYAAFEGWGTSLVWWANKWGGLPDAQRNAMADAVFDPTNGLGFNIVRYNLGADGPGNVCHDRMTRAGVYTNIPSLEPTAGTFDWSRDANQRWMMQAAKIRGANQFEAFVNSAPAWMLDNGCTAGAARPSSGLGENLSSARYNDFATYIATIAKHFHDVDGITFRTVAPFNEPTQGYWYADNDQEGMNVSGSNQNDLIKRVGAALVANGAASYTNVSAMDDSVIDSAISTYTSGYDSTARGYLSQINTHSYGGNNRSGMYQLAQQEGKRLWMSEWGDGANGPLDAALRLGNQVTRDIKQMHPAAWIIWQAANSDNNAGGDNVWGLVGNDNAYNLTFPPRYWAMAQFSKFIRPGYRFIENTGGNTLTAYDASSQKLVIVTTNAGSSDTTVTYDLSAFSAVGSATAYRTSATENLAALPATTITNRSFSAPAKANSITTYVVSGVIYTAPTTGATNVNDATTGTGLNQFEYLGNWSYGSQSGAYQNDNHWSGEINSAYQVRFNGTQVKLYGAKDPNHGIAAVSIDGGSTVDVDFYGSSRQDNALLWVSPSLGSGPHTLTVQVTGRKNPQSGGAWFNADRVEVTATPVQLSGAAVGAGGSWSANNASDYSKATDNNVATFFDPATTPAWTGLDLGAAKTITRVEFYPRAGFTDRMLGGKFQGSNTADFSSGVVDLGTITATPPDNQWTGFNLSTAGSFRYVRYLAASAQWCNVAELRFFGS